MARILPALRQARIGLRRRPARPEMKSVTKDAKPAHPASITIPITVRGRATDSEGKPVAGATIYLVSTNGKNAPLGTMTTDRDGSYIFRNARLPVSRGWDDAPLAGTFQVYGTAPDHGFAWHGMRFYQHERRPADRKVAGEDYSLFGSDPKVMDLRFPPAATISGRIMDETGRPVPGATIRIGDCDYLDTEGKESHHNFREFWAIHAAPAGLKRRKPARTVASGWKVCRRRRASGSMWSIRTTPGWAFMPRPPPGRRPRSSTRVNRSETNGHRSRPES